MAETTSVFSKLLEAYIDPTVRIILMRGGTRSGKTFSTMQLLDVIGRKSKRKRLISAVSESMPHLKRGCMRDFENLLGDAFNHQLWNATDKIYQYKNAAIEFFGVDNPGKVHGSARDILFINEGIFIDYEIYRQLAVRTREKVIIDYNPAWEFWADSKLMHRADVRVIDSTYLDNEFLTESQVAEIEANKLIDPEWFKVYGEGKVGTAEGLVVKKWDIVGEMPKTFKKEWLGIDFGWSNPTAIMHVGLGERNEVYIDEIAYRRGMDNGDIAQAIKDAGLAHLRAICDEAEPKSIAELEAKGIKAEATRNKDIKLGIRIMNRYAKHYTARSVGSISENRKYRYPRDKEGNIVEDMPINKDNHAKDAERYIFLNCLSDIPEPKGGVTFPKGAKSKRKSYNI